MARFLNATGSVRVKTLLGLTGIVSALLGATIVYFVLTVPNDIEAGALLRNARKDIAEGRNDRARGALARIVQQYPRTDAAGAANAALAAMADHERQALQASLDALRRDAAAQKTQLADLEKKVATLAAAPPPPPPPQPQPKPRPAPKKTARKKRHRR